MNLEYDLSRLILHENDILVVRVYKEITPKVREIINKQLEPFKDILEEKNVKIMILSGDMNIESWYALRESELYCTPKKE